MRPTSCEKKTKDTAHQHRANTRQLNIDRKGGVSQSLTGRTGTPLFLCPLLRNRGEKSLDLCGFAGAKTEGQGIYTLSPQNRVSTA